MDSNFETKFAALYVEDAGFSNEVVNDLVNHFKQLMTSSDNDKDAKLQKALQVAGDLARKENNRQVFAEVPTIIDVVSELMASSSNIDTLKLTARLIGNLCFDHVMNRKAFQDKDSVLKAIVQLLKHEDDQAQRNAAGAIANLASENTHIQNIFGDLDAMKSLIPLLTSDNEVVQMMASRAVNNLIDNTACQDSFINNKGLDVFLKFQDSEEEQLQSDMVSIIHSVAFNDKHRSLLIPHAITPLINIALARTEIVTDEMQESALDAITLLADKDDTRAVLLKNNVFKLIMGLATTGNARSQVEKAVFKIFANLSCTETVLPEFISYFDLLVSTLKRDELELTISCLLILGNLARTDEQCKQMVQKEGFTALMVHLANHKDLRVQHLTMGAIRNLCIAAENKDKFVKEGLIPILIAHLRTTENANAHIQFDVVGVFRSLIANQGEHFIDIIAQDNGIETLISLAKGDLEPKQKQQEEAEEGKEKDRRVEYEATRLLIRIAERKAYQPIIAQHGVVPLLDLVRSKYEILQAEGLKAILTLAQAGFVGELNSVGTLDVIASYKSSNPAVQDVCNQIVQILSK